MLQRNLFPKNVSLYKNNNMKKLLFLFAFAPFLMATTCDNNDDEGIVCTMEAVAGLNVTVKDATTNDYLSTAVVVTATDGSYSEQLDLMSGDTPSFAGAWERPGTYTVVVSKAGYQTATFSNIVVTSDVCHVIPQNLSVLLESE